MSTPARPTLHLAQLNVARLRASMTDPSVREFVDNLDRVNAVADSSPGFVWRYQTDTGHGPLIDDQTIANLSVWRTYPDLHRFTYRSLHGHFTRRRRRWFEQIQGPTTVLWWVPAGKTPTVPDGLARLRRLASHGPSPEAFSLLRQFDEHGRPVRRGNADVIAARPR